MIGPAQAWHRFAHRRRARKAIDRIVWRGAGLVMAGLIALTVNDRHAWDAINAKAERDLRSVDLLNARLKSVAT